MAWSNKPLELTGLKFGKLTVMRRLENDRHGKTRWLCSCECGSETPVNSRSLVAGNSTQCPSCYGKKRKAGFNMKHGGAIGKWTPTYRSYKAMLTRCYNPKAQYFHLYGGR